MLTALTLSDTIVSAISDLLPQEDMHHIEGRVTTLETGSARFHFQGVQSSSADVRALKSSGFIVSGQNATSSCQIHIRLLFSWRPLGTELFETFVWEWVKFFGVVGWWAHKAGTQRCLWCCTPWLGKKKPDSHLEKNVKQWSYLNPPPPLDKWPVS